MNARLRERASFLRDEQRAVGDPDGQPSLPAPTRPREQRQSERHHDRQMGTTTL